MKGMRPVLLFALLLSPAFGQIVTTVIDPQKTDPAIDAGPSHLAATLNAPFSANLIVFLPGTGGTPADYSFFINRAAGFGFPVLGLAYPNATAINTLCATTNDINCFEDTRNEIIDGTPRSAFVSVNRANSIENRLIQALRYLAATQPGLGWDRYYSGNAIRWDRIIISGHSQGAGHAGLIAKRYFTARAVLFAGMDYSERLNQLAPWMAKPSATPTAATFAMCHTLDMTIDYATISSKAWPAQGINIYGPIVAADGPNPSFFSTRTLTAISIPPPGAPPHGVIVSNNIRLMPVSVQNQYIEAWRYLLSGAAATVTNSASYAASVVAADSLATIFAPGIKAGASYSLTIGSQPATIFASATNQLNVLIPKLAAGSTSAVELRGPDGAVWTGTVELVTSAPGLFTSNFSGQGEAAGSYTKGPSGWVATLYGTGFRGATIAVTLDGNPAEVLYAGSQGQFVGLDQLNVAIPASLQGRRNVELTLKANGVAANTVLLNLP